MISSEDQKKIWEVELEILDSIDRICRENNIKYSLAYGSLIGAVRHGGFIPWDDDVDIMMPRVDYEKLLSIWEKVNHDGLVLQNKKLEPDFSQNFTKIRKDHTAFLHSENEKKATYHTGIFIDIFPFDKMNTKGICKKMQYGACAINLLFSREFTSKSGGKTERIEKILLKLPRSFRLNLRNKADRFAQKWNNKIVSIVLCKLRNRFLVQCIPSTSGCCVSQPGLTVKGAEHRFAA